MAATLVWECMDLASIHPGLTHATATLRLTLMASLAPVYSFSIFLLLFFFLLFSLSLFHPRTSVGQPLEDTDQAALVAFWFGVANPSPLGWNTNYSLCGQFGVICISQPPGYSVLEL